MRYNDRDMQEKLKHTGFYSFLKADDEPKDYYTTTVDNEIILFQDGVKQLFLNSLVVENCGTSTMRVRPINSEYVQVIPAGGPVEIAYLAMTGVQIMGSAGQKLRYSGCYY